MWPPYPLVLLAGTQILCSNETIPDSTQIATGLSTFRRCTYTEFRFYLVEIWANIFNFEGKRYEWSPVRNCISSRMKYWANDLRFLPALLIYFNDFAWKSLSDMLKINSVKNDVMLYSNLNLESKYKSKSYGAGIWLRGVNSGWCMWCSWATFKLKESW